MIVGKVHKNSAMILQPV